LKTLGEEKKPDLRSSSRPQKEKGKAASFACRAFCLKKILRKNKENIVLPLREGVDGSACMERRLADRSQAR